MKLKAVCLMGPTCSGKTALAIELLSLFPMEIISVDSALIYRGMDIGTAKPDKETLARAPHHLIDIRLPTESYSAADFCVDVKALIEQIQQRGNIPLLVGGTMMYFRALQQGLSVLPQADELLREQLEQQAQQLGWQKMYERLQQVDPISAQRIHPNDPQRLQRALEVFYLTGKPLSAHFVDERAQNNIHYLNLALIPDRKILHQKIADRFQQMLNQGFIAECEQLLANYHLNASMPSMRSVGYRQVLAYLNNEMDYNTLIEKGIVATRQLAKRQYTWLRSWPEIHNFDSENENVLTDVSELIREFLLNNCL